MPNEQRQRALLNANSFGVTSPPLADIGGAASGSEQFGLGAVAGSGLGNFSNTAVGAGALAGSSPGSTSCIAVGPNAVSDGPTGAIAIGDSALAGANQCRVGSSTGAPINDFGVVGAAPNPTFRAHRMPGGPSETGLETWADVGAGPVFKLIRADIVPPAGSFLLYVVP